MKYYELDSKKAAEYVRKTDLFPSDSVLTAEEIGDGNLNMVFRIRCDKTQKSMIIKQALPYLRVAGESWPLTLDRIRIEASAIEIQSRHAADLVPKIFHRNNDMALMIMEDLSHLEVMRKGTVRMKKYPKFADHISTFLANTLFYTSDLFLAPPDKKLLAKTFINPELCKITEELIFTDPYYDAESNIINPPLRPYLENVFWKKDLLRLEATKFKYKFLTEAQCLVHGDLHTGSIFASEEETVVFDTEFAFVGPAAFDIGLLIGNLLINYVSWSGKQDTDKQKKDYREYLLETINEIYSLFEKKFSANWEKDINDIAAQVKGYKEYYMRNIFVDTIGYAAIVMIRRMHGLAHNIDVDQIEDLEVRKDVQISVLELAEALMMNRESFENIQALTKQVKNKIF